MMIYEILLTSSVLILGVFCLRKLTMGKISMRLRYALWLLVAVRLLVPVSVGTSAFSVLNLLPETVRERAQTPFSERGNGQRLSADEEPGVAFTEGHDSGFSDRKNPGAELADGQTGMKTGSTSASAANVAYGETASEKHGAA
ncbi:MAG: M56 family metallopeptidase, partial [Lachnospiraceae bacterium]|nr:M56 family metallopeptidase [Lachnospiraceae bacterium]